MKSHQKATSCPCDSGNVYTQCCGRFIDNDEPAQTPEQLMRSRYTAFTQANMTYLVKTMRGPAAEAFNVKEAKHWAQSVHWLRLEVHNHAMLSDKEGTVTFTAYFRVGSSLQSMYENSLFHKIDGCWYYVGQHQA